MAEDKPLIAGEQSASWSLGTGVAEGIATPVEKMIKGDWAQGLAATPGAVISVGTLGADPFAALATAGFGWLMEHVSFLKEPLDALTGDQQAIDSMSTTWANIGEEVQSVSNDFTKAVQRDTGPWDGEAAESYKNTAREKASHLDSLSTACTGAGNAVKMCGQFLSVVRDIIRDLISQTVGELITAGLEWLAAEGLSFGATTPAMIVDLIRRALRAAKKISSWTKRVTEALSELGKSFDELGKGLAMLRKVLGKMFGASPFGKDNKINRPKIGSLGLGQGATHLDSATTAANKAVGKVKSQSATALDGDYMQPSDPEASDTPDNRNSYQQ